MPPGDAGALAAALLSALGDSTSAGRRALAAAQHVRALFTWAALRPTLLAAYDQAISACGNDVERAHLRRRLEDLG